jgi:LysR family transcriptional regulator, hypochlorite-specific transcription factor HypT
LGGILRAVHGLALRRLPAQHVLTAHLASVLRTMVLDNRGVAWLPATLVSEDITSGRLAVAASEDWRIRLEIRLYRDRTPLGPAGERFWEAVSNSARGSDILRPLLGPVQ